MSCLHVETWPMNLSRPLITELLCQKSKALKRIDAKAMIKCPWLKDPGVFADRGTVQKVIVLPRDDLQTEELVLEEVEVFKVRSNFFVLGCWFFLLFFLGGGGVALYHNVWLFFFNECFRGFFGLAHDTFYFLNLKLLSLLAGSHFNHNHEDFI